NFFVVEAVIQTEIFLPLFKLFKTQFLLVSKNMIVNFYKFFFVTSREISRLLQIFLCHKPRDKPLYRQNGASHALIPDYKRYPKDKKDIGCLPYLHNLSPDQEFVLKQVYRKDIGNRKKQKF